MMMMVITLCQARVPQLFSKNYNPIAACNPSSVAIAEMRRSAPSPAQKPEFSILVQMFNAGEKRGNMKHRKLIQKWEL
jgi:hypothetical protein